MADYLGLAPFVPSGPDFDRARALFRELGFDELWSTDDYVGFVSGGVKFILQRYDHEAFASNYMIAIDVPDLDAWWNETSAKGLAERFEGFSIKEPTDFPWGREVHFIDLAGVCWHVRQP